METIIRKAVDCDVETIVSFSVALSRFNRENHSEKCKYDDDRNVYSAIAKSAKESFETRQETTLILIAEIENKPVGYAIGRILIQEPHADNGTGRYGLIDELFVLDNARGAGLGRKFMDELTAWFVLNDIQRIKLHAYAWNQNAIAMYQRFGFDTYVVSMEKFI